VAWAVLLTFVAVSSAYAEVMDKEPAVADLWVSAVAFGAAGAAAWVWKPWLGFVTSLVMLFFAWGIYGELTDPFVGKDILREAGPTYSHHVYASIAVSIVPHVAAVAFRLSRRNSGAPIRESA
jgi:hypothetical protein